jgi:hypothetical protein
LIVLNNAFSGANQYDLGFIFNRGSSPNKAFYWDESSAEFKLITTTETGTTYGNIAAETNYEKLHLGNLIAQYDVSTATLTATGLINTTGNISGAVLNAGAINSTGLINTTGNISGAVLNAGAINSTGLINTTGNISAATIIAGQFNTTGNVSASQVSTATLNATGLINTLGNISAAVLNAGAINSTGLINTTGNVSAASVIAGQFNTTGNVSASQVSTATLKASGLTSGRVVYTGTGGLLVDNAGITFTANTLTVGGAKPITINGNTATIATTGTNQNLLLAPSGSGVVDFNATYATNLHDPISNSDAVTLGYLNTRISTGVTTLISDNTDWVVTDDGVNRGVITSNVDGILVQVITSDLFTKKRDVLVSNATTSTSTTTGALVVTGGVGVGGNITVGGNIKATDVTQSTSTTTGAIITAGGLGVAKNLTVGGDATITGNLTVQGRLTAIQSTTLDVTDVQITLAKGAGTSAAADGAGINVDYGNVGANITYTHATTSWNFNRAVIGTSYANFGGNVLATNFVGGGVNVSGNVLAASAVLGSLTVNGLTTTAGINSSANVLATGGIFNALTVNGATTQAGTLTVTSGFINSSGNILATGAVLNALTVNGVTTLTGNLSLSGSSNIIAGGTAGTSGQVLQATGTGVSWVTLGAVANKIYSGGSNVTVETNYANVSILGGNVAIFRAEGISAAIGAYSANTAQFTTLSASQNVTFNNYTGYLKAAGGSPLSASGTIPNTDITGLGSMSTQNSTSISVTGGSVNGTTIGSSTASSGKFTTLEATQTGLFNSAQGVNTFTIKGVSDAALFVVTPSATGGLDGVVINGAGNTTPSYGAGLKVGGTGAIQIPFGSTAQRPGSNGNVDLVGMVRYNTTSNNLEFCTAAGAPGTYTAAGSVFTTITTNAFSGNGVQTVFTLSSSSTTSGTIVMVNGVVQIPTTAYSVSGTSLTFTEAPATGDAIDARVLITTATVSQLASGNGYDSFDVSSDTYANITAGTSSATVRMSIDGATGTATFTNDVVINGNLTVKGGSSGNINIGDQTTDKVQLQGTVVYDQTALTAQGTNLKLLDSFSTSAYHTAKYLVQIRDGANIESAEVLLAQDGVNVSITTYAVIAPAGALGTFQSNISSGTVRWFFTPSISTYANIKVQTTYIV